MGKTRRNKPAELLRAIEKLRVKCGERLARRDGTRIRKGQPTQNTFVAYLD
jgi:hypothetical protein